MLVHRGALNIVGDWVQNCLILSGQSTESAKRELKFGVNESMNGLCRRSTVLSLALTLSVRVKDQAFMTFVLQNKGLREQRELV